jgi:hypothetical protein
VHGAGGAADGAVGESALGEAVGAAVGTAVGTAVGIAGADGEAQLGPPLPTGPGHAVIDLTGDDNNEDAEPVPRRGAEPVPRRGAQYSKKRRL